MVEESHTEQGQGPTPEEEAALVDACVSGDAGAWREFVDSYGPRVYSAMRYFMRSFQESLPEEDTQNVYQDMFLDLCSDGFRKLRTFRGGGNLATWLFTVARRQCLDYVRAISRKKRMRPTLTEPEILDAGERVHESESAFAAAENREAVLAALEKVDARDRLLLVLFYFEGLSYEEIAKVTGFSDKSVSAMLRKARESIARILGE